MFIMQNNESSNPMAHHKRLIKAAKRTIRAEVTLVIIIIVISSWSMYALYRFTMGSDSFFGLTFARPYRQDRTNLHQNVTSQSNSNQPSAADNTQQSILANQQPQFPAFNYSLQDDVKHKSQQLLQQLIAGQRELYANLDSFRSPIIGPLEQFRRLPLAVTADRPGEGNRLRPMPGHGLVQQQQQQQLAHFQVANNRIPTSDYRSPYLRPSSRLKLPEQSIDRSALPEPEVDSGDKSEEDREAAESSRESGESIVDGSSSSLPPEGQSASGEGESLASTDAETGSNTSDEAPDQEGTQEDQPQTTTQASESADSSADQGGSGSGEESEGSSRSDEDQAPKETSQSIDDEVERMTQPSSGVVHQQERPFDYKNTVQFDDSLPSGIGAGFSMDSKAVPPGNQVARFVAPQTVKTLAINDDSDEERGDLDLQVDHNRLVIRNGNLNDTSKPESTSEDEEMSSTKRTNSNLKRRTKVISAGNPKKHADRANDTKAKEYDASMELYTVSRAKRRKRDLAKIGGRVTKIRAPYEIESFLDSLNFDSLVGLESESGLQVRHPRALNKNSSPLSVKVDDLNKPKVIESNVDSLADTRRSSEDEYGINDIDFDPATITRPDFTQIHGLTNSSQPMPSYVLSNDSALQDLLNQQQLLDALKYSQLPAPSDQNNSDTKTAGSLYHIDHGLTLVPSADVSHPHKTKKSSMSKKKKKHKKMKDKKKSTVAYKKGGHKKKKHKKEEKKYLKEKKFKGAKKGKKVSKGKGGAGGKKGKKLYKDKGYKKKGFKKVYHKEEWGNKKSFFDEFRDKDFKKKWKKFDDKYNYAQMKKFQAKDEKGAKKVKHHDESHKKYDKGKWKKSYQKHSKEHKESHKKDKKKKSEGMD